MDPLLAKLRKLPLPLLDVSPVEGLNGLDLVQVIVAGSEAAGAWRTLRDAVPDTQRWPVILGGRESVEGFRERANRWKEKQAPLNDQVQQWLRQAEAEPFEKWLENQRDPAWKANDYLRQAEAVEKFPGGESMGKLYRQFADNYRGLQPEVFDPSTCEWPTRKGARVDTISVLNDLSTVVFEEVGGRIMRGPELYPEAAIILLPTTSGWEAPAWLFFGGFNACPFPEVHVAMAQWGFRQHTAEVVALSHDTFELQCVRSPATRENALRLARDLGTYAEVVTLESKTLGILASALKNGSIWSCWWD